MSKSSSRLLLALSLSLLALALSAGPAFAQSSWWGLSSGSRPSYLHAGGTGQVQEITVTNEVGQGAFELGVGSTELGFFVYPEAFANELGLPVMTAANIQAALEGPYGAGKVSVTEHQEGETLSFKVTSPPGVPLTVNNAGIGSAKAKVISSGTDGELVITAENLGDQNAEGEGNAVKLIDHLPSGLKAIGVSGWKAGPQAAANVPVQIPCSSQAEAEEGKLHCSFEGPIPPYEAIEMRIAVNVQGGASSEEENEALVSGGASKPAKLRRHIKIEGGQTPFGIEDYGLTHEEEGGLPAIQAGAHPFQQTTTIILNQGPDPSLLSHKQETQPAGLAKDTELIWPAGLIGNPSAIPKCAISQFLTKINSEENECPPKTVVGVAVISLNEPAVVGAATFTLPLFNLEPAKGEPARFGFNVLVAHAPVVIDTKVRSGNDYGVTVQAKNITQTAGFLSAKVTVWGTPGDPRHDGARGWGCLYEAREANSPHEPCTPLGERHPKPFLVLPTSCPKTPLQSTILADSWSDPGAFGELAGEPVPALVGCERLPFEGSIKVAPDGQAASTPTGLNVDVHVPQEVNENGAGLASSNLKDISVTFPPGVTLNPAAADGLQACSEGQIGYLSGQSTPPADLHFTSELEEPFCPDAAKVGTATIKTPLLPNPLVGALYLATPAPNGEAGKNPFKTLVAAYIVAKDPVSGVVVKLPGRVSLDQNTGQITATFEHNPQVAFEDAEIHLFGGDRAPFSTPSHCGTYTTEAMLTPWSGTMPIHSSSSFQVTSGPGGGPCPSTLPFSPTLTAGTSNIQAGAFSPLSTTIARADGNQDIQSVALHMPPGLSGILKGLALCSEANANAGTCGPESLIGHTIVSVGLGGDPFSVTGGQVFLTEGYKGASFGLSIVNPAVAGPFDLGKVIVRAKIEVDPHTAALAVMTDPAGAYAIPHILDGIPLQIKRVNVTIDRPGFIFNPTNCNPQALTGTIASDEAASAPVSVPFQVTNCAALKFTPKFSVSTSGKNSKAGGASLTVKLSEPNEPQGSQANIKSVRVELPKQLPSRLTTLQKACTAAQFASNPAGCPSASIIGHAIVHTPLLPVPLEGPAYFVSNGGEAFPNLIMVLQGYGVRVDLVGDTFISKAGITSSTFKTVPDVPFSTFELTLPQGPSSALTTNVPAKANYSLCGRKLSMPTEFVAQNGGAPLTQNTPVSVTGCVKTKALTRAQKLTRALKACRKHKKKAKRAACERAARKRFAPPVKRSARSTRRSKR